MKLQEEHIEKIWLCLNDIKKDNIAKINVTNLTFFTDLPRMKVCNILIELAKRNCIKKTGKSTYTLLLPCLAQRKTTIMKPIGNKLDNATPNETDYSKVNKVPVKVRKVLDIDHIDDDYFFGVGQRQARYVI